MSALRSVISRPSFESLRMTWRRLRMTWWLLAMGYEGLGPSTSWTKSFGRMYLAKAARIWAALIFA